MSSAPSTLLLGQGKGQGDSLLILQVKYNQVKQHGIGIAWYISCIVLLFVVLLIPIQHTVI